MDLILAADEKWAIGNNGQLLCHLPSDLKYFKEKTLNSMVLMGRKTFESLPGGKGLPNRVNVVLTSDQNFKGEDAIVVHSVEEMLELAKTSTIPVFLIGGGMLYRKLYQSCELCYITKLRGDFEADTFFVNLDEDENFQLIEEGPLMEENHVKFNFCVYENKGLKEKINDK